MSPLCGAVSLLLLGGAGHEAPVPFPHVRTIPLPGHQVSFEAGGEEAVRFHFGPDSPRPFVFPFTGPSGHRLTRMGHPHDPYGHRHHRSIWIGHRNVNGLNFWEEDEPAAIRHERTESLTDGPESASVTVQLTWQDGDGVPVLRERRTLSLLLLSDGGRCLDITMVFTPADTGVTFGKTPFGLLGVRVAKTMSVADGDGVVRNSEGGVNEEGTLWQRARWVDYTGSADPTTRAGIALFDHPENPRFPTYFHVRNDGWMGASFCYAEPFTLDSGDSLSLRYRLYAHDGDATPDTIDQRWHEFAEW